MLMTLNATEGISLPPDVSLAVPDKYEHLRADGKMQHHHRQPQHWCHIYLPRPIPTLAPPVPRHTSAAATAARVPAVVAMPTAAAIAAAAAIKVPLQFIL